MDNLKNFNLTSQELGKLDCAINRIRHCVKVENYLHRVSGGYCSIEILEIDSEKIEAELSMGTSDEGGSSCTAYVISFDRSLVQDEATVSEIMGNIKWGDKIASYHQMNNVIEKNGEYTFEAGELEGFDNRKLK